MPGVASEISDALRTVAGALCMCAVSAFAKSFEDQVELAAGAMDACSNGFEGADVTEEASKRLIEAIKGKRK
jgi:hypothetical protein